jgi:hypothetical protein
MGENLTRKKLKAIIMGLLAVIFSLVKLCYDMHIAYENVVMEKDEELSKIRDELLNIQRVVATDNAEQSSNWKWIGGVSILIISTGLISYFTGIDPSQMLKGLNSLGFEVASFAKENNQFTADGNKEVIDAIVKCIEELNKAMNSRMDQMGESNFTLFKSILKHLTSGRSNDEFFGNNNPPSFR